MRPTLPESVIVVLSPLHTLLVVAVAVPPTEVELTVNVAALEVADGLHVPLTMQSKLAPESPITAFDTVRLAVPEPLIVPPSLRSEPFIRHWYVRLVPDAVTEKPVVPPTHTVCGLGPIEMLGGALTVIDRLPAVPVHALALAGVTVTLPETADPL